MHDGIYNSIRAFLFVFLVAMVTIICIAEKQDMPPEKDTLTDCIETHNPPQK